MRVIFGSMLAVGLLGAPALARDWMLIYGAGDAPQRRVLYADIDSLRPGTEPDSLQMTAVEVLEDHQQPDTCQYHLQLSPAKDLIYLVSEQRRLRSGKEEGVQPATPALHATFWSTEALNFATDKSGWRGGYEKLRQARPEQADIESAQAELLALGYLLVLDRDSPAELSALTWATTWGDNAAHHPATLRVSTTEKDFAKKWATYWLSPKRKVQLANPSARPR